MALFYFHIRDGRTAAVVEDDEGRELPDAGTAQSEAIADALDILITRFALVSVDDRRRWSIDVCNSSGERVLIVPLGEIKVPPALARMHRPVVPGRKHSQAVAGQDDCLSCHAIEAAPTRPRGPRG